MRNGLLTIGYFFLWNWKQKATSSEKTKENKTLKTSLHRILSSEDMILALTGQFKQLSHEPEKFRWLNGIRTHDLCDAGAVL